MDAAGLDVQVLSLNSPGVEQADAAEQIAIARDANDFLAEAIKKHPTRLAGFAVLPVASPERAAEELERSVRQLGFKGTLINGHTRGRYLDDKFFCRSWSARLRSTCRSIFTRPYRRRPSSKRLYSGSRPR